MPSSGKRSIIDIDLSTSPNKSKRARSAKDGREEGMSTAASASATQVEETAAEASATQVEVMGTQLSETQPYYAETQPYYAESASQSQEVAIDNKDAGIKVGSIIRARYGTTNQETMVGDNIRTLLVLKRGRSDQCAYHKAHLTVKPGYWCMHRGERKFFASSRFISSHEISPVEALLLEDSPVVLRREYEHSMNHLLRQLRSINAGLSNCSTNLHLRAKVTMDDNNL